MAGKKCDFGGKSPYPYEKWVVDSWRQHSKSIGGPAIGEAFRKNLLGVGLPMTISRAGAKETTYFEVNTETYEELERLKPVFGVYTAAEVIKKSLALARVCTDNAVDGKLTIMKDGNLVTVLLKE